uniref:Apoptosis-inducing factor 3-like n=1 Tax=Phallusia mammillata TaxID=59560 RepID=A0A6F9D6Q8_9ASCI|nr:apoptosis-inducing factor 3-like [Phallusia mammillata]
MSDEFFEESVCKVGDLSVATENGKSECMKEVELGQGKCLIVRHKDGKITAVGHKCTHYGAPLIKGVLNNGRIRCPWHGACFNAETGDIEDFPGLDSIHSFQVRIESDDVIVRARRDQLTNNKRNLLAGKTGLDCSNCYDEDGRVVIIGGGPSSLTCAETMRKEGFTGRIVLLSKDRHPPYDRPKLSKALNIEPDKAYLRGNADYYKSIGIELHNNVEVVGVNVVTKSVKVSKPVPDCTANGNLHVTYDKLVIATGGQPRTLAPTPGWNLKNIFVLRTPDDANAIAKASKDRQVVVVGSSFIGMEVAAYLADKKIAESVSVVCGKRSSVPFEGSLGKEVGTMIMQMNEEKGSVLFYPKAGVVGLGGGEGNGASSVKKVKLSDGNVLDADVVVVGIGVNPATQFLNDSELRLTDRGFIPVDARMQTKVPNVYAVGDVALFPLAMKDGELSNIQHWQMAHAHGRIAGLDIVKSLQRTKSGKSAATSFSTSGQSVNSVPFFWTVQYGSSIRYAGHGVGYDDVSICGDVSARKFAAYYLKKDVVVAVATMNADPVAANMAEKLANGVVMRRIDIPPCLV